MSEGNGDQSQQQRPWASPRQQPVKGIVQPRVLPPFGKPTRHTNKLDYIMNTVLKEVSKHKHVWPFQKPVDAVTLCIPLYHERVTRPMDLKTIENRLKSTYYTCAQECIEDIETVFNNCYLFNGKEDDVTIMAQNVHEVIKKSLEQAPREEHDMDVYWGKQKKKAKNVDSKKSVPSEKKKDVRGPSEPPSESGSEVAAVVKPERKVAGKKTGKRKAESDDEDKSGSQRAKREVTTSKKETHHPLSPAMKPCMKLLNDFYAKKSAEFAWPFYDPVDADIMGLHDYHKIVQKPMDLRTIKGKLESGEYKDPSEFESDIRLMLDNCFLYNPMGDPVNTLGQRFKEVFERKWAELGDSNSRASSVAPTSAPVSVAPVATPKLPKANTAKAQKTEVKVELFESGGSKSEDLTQINNALSMIREREERLRLDLAAAETMKEKLLSVKSRREENPNEPFPSKLITETRIMCTSQSSHAASGSSGYKNGKGKKLQGNKEYVFDSDDEENQVALTYSEKRNLSVLINSLPPDKLSTIISIIQRREHSALSKQTQGDSEVELDFEALGDMCLREMSAFIKSLGSLDKKVVPSTSSRPSTQTEQARAAPKMETKPEKKISEKNFNMSESSDDETSNNRKRRKNNSSDSESSSTSDEDSDDETTNIPRKSGQPPSTSHEWNHAAPPPRMGGMGGQPPMARVPPQSAMGKNPSGSTANSYQAPSKVAQPLPVTKPSVPKTAERSSTLGASTSSKSNEKPVKKSAPSTGHSILDSLLPDEFGAAQGTPGTSTGSTNNTTSPKENGQPENGENEAARIQRLRMEAKQARQREDENTMSMSNQMEMMSAFEFDDIY